MITEVFSGFLNVTNSNRSLHYVFMKSLKNDTNNTVPTLLWLNGGPGCSSLLGMA